MKTNCTLKSLGFMALLLSTLNLPLSTIFAQGTAFTYQGALQDNGVPASGSYSLRFILYNAEFGGSQVGPTLTNEPVAVADGLFTATLDFGAAVLDGAPRFLEVGVRPNGSAALHTSLSPRQPLGSAPYAFRAARLTGTLPDGQLSANVARLNGNGTFIGTVTFDPRSGPPFAVGNAEVVTKLNADLLDGQDASDFAPAGHNHDTNYWKLTGNTGANSTNGVFLGTTDNQPLDIRVNNRRALRLEPNPNSPRLIGGFSGNSAATGAHGVVIGGGGFAGNANRADALLTVISGGSANTNAGDGAFIGGGFQNSIQPAAYNATIVGGAYNGIGTNSAYSAIGGGIDNNINIDSPYSTIAGGIANGIGTNSGSSTMGGGNNNNISTDSAHATISGGLVNNIGTNSPGAVIGGGRNNSIADDSSYATIAGGSFGKIGDEAQFSVIVGGEDNAIGNDGDHNAIGGGYTNNIANGSSGSVIAGGFRNNISTNGTFSAIGGGIANVIAPYAFYATIPGGIANFAASRAFAAGSGAKANHSGAFVWADDSPATVTSTNNNSVTMRANGGYRLFSSTGGQGVFLAPGGGSWTAMSDRNAKENFEPINARTVLDKVATLPLSMWNYKAQTNGVRHIGPMAQDFKAAFAVGETDTGITTVDADGVALAAIQGLNQKLTEELKRRDAENAELKQELRELKQVVQALAAREETRP